MDIKLIKKLYSLKKYSIFSAITVLVLLGLYMVFLAVENSYNVDLPIYTLGLGVFILLEIINIVIFVYTLIKSKHINYSSEYHSTVSLFADYYCHNDDNSSDGIFVDKDGTISSVREIKNSFLQNPKLVLDAANEKKPMSYILLLVVSVVLLTVSFVPRYIQVKSEYDKGINKVTTQLLELEKAFSAFGENNYYVDNPEDYYSRYGYGANGQLYEDDYDTSIWVHVDNEGKINSINYTVSVDKTLTKEENLKFVQDSLDKMHEILSKADVVAEAKMLERVVLSQEFIDEFMLNGYGEGCIVDDNSHWDDNRFYKSEAYFTSPEEDEYDYSYIEVMLGVYDEY